MFLSQTGARPLRIQVSPVENAKKVPSISKNDVLKIKTDLCLSSRQTFTLAKHLRVATRKRSLFESGLKESIHENHRVFDNLFKVNNTEFNNCVSKPVVMCMNIDKPIPCIYHQYANITSIRFPAHMLGLEQFWNSFISFLKGSSVLVVN